MCAHGQAQGRAFTAEEAMTPRLASPQVFLAVHDRWAPAMARVSRELAYR